MENEIKVGEYVRANGGYIGKVIKIREKDRDCDTYYVCDTVMASGFYENIVKHSSNLIDLIQCGDYVNGREVKHIADFEGINKPIKKLIFVDEKHLIPGETAENEDIKTIVTKEQFEFISYKATKM